MSDHTPSLYTSIEDAVFALAASPELPATAVTLCTVRYSESARLLRAVLQRGANGEILGEEEARLLFRSLFIIGGRRDPLGFEPLLRLLRRPNEEVEWVLGDAITEALSLIVAGVFDGNADALFAAILDLDLDEFIRLALFGAATFLTWDSRIERERMTTFLERFYQERGAPDFDSAWLGWTEAIALLGLRALAPMVQSALDEREVVHDLIDGAEFTAILERAEREPDDPERFKDERLGYIEDVLETLGGFSEVEAEGSDDSGSLPIDEPVINPMRHVGRNDPCPCGSGKKAKRCCLAA
jgi:hypothetical protein